MFICEYNRTITSYKRFFVEITPHLTILQICIISLPKSFVFSKIVEILALKKEIFSQVLMNSVNFVITYDDSIVMHTICPFIYNDKQKSNLIIVL